ncbi:exported hypothetical protein [Cupriavidus taiwanensis]|uniref:Uncharacterized protein n=1 Tax=Cupriavidus taiwanensis TaxID=164546 RepID=A0A976G3Y8_9BURK|nr:exported hypothetical protein [Cupriavidus taiwanensis]SOZ65074.1 exported hypothetical protein [Cupriavidus taiwanensis]SOZ68772.1 exported hypothetical protein [Cupriavidus taiwanensis]SPA01585.1 exported hypothetical protein [Cupriavidus taiwanensis]SPA08186.1 exported hypothetical protein [Cupriavidus taiwanensis]
MQAAAACVAPRCPSLLSCLVLSCPALPAHSAAENFEQRSQVLALAAEGVGRKLATDAPEDATRRPPAPRHAKIAHRTTSEPSETQIDDITSYARRPLQDIRRRHFGGEPGARLRPDKSGRRRVGHSDLCRTAQRRRHRPSSTHRGETNCRARCSGPPPSHRPIR